MQEHHAHMRAALELAKVRQGFTAPNPAVGAVIIKNGEIIGQGYHHAAGCPHAEVEALKKLSINQTRGASLYVTLEPCSHQGKTPPCVDAILAAGIQKVYYGLLDPNPVVAGKGIEKLTAAGVNCTEISLTALKRFYAGYSHWHTTGLPYVTLKLAMSLDAKIAAEGGKPIAITGETAKQFTHACRKKSHAILTTAQTILCDNPQLNVRIDEEVYSKPVYILDRSLKTPLTSRIFETAASVTLFHEAGIDADKRQPFEKKGARCLAVTSNLQKLELRDVLRAISRDGYFELFVEAGGRCFQAFIESGFAQRALIYIAPKTLGDQAISAFSTHVNIFASAKSVKWHTMGEDIRCELLVY